MGTVTLVPVTSYNLPGQAAPTAFGGFATTEQSLGDDTDTTGIHWGTTFPGYSYHKVYVVFAAKSTWLPTGARIDWLRWDYRARHQYAACFMWIDYAACWDVNGVAHYKWYPLVGYAIDGDVATNLSTATSRTLDDGTPWNSCDTFHCGIGRYGPDANVNEFPWNPSNYPYMTKLRLEVGYTLKPIVTDITPSTTTEDPRPEVTWSVDDLEDKPPTAHQVIVLPPGSTDSAGRAMTNPLFDPTTGSGVAYNSNKKFASALNEQIPTVLTPGTWHLWVKQWIGSGVDEYASDWESEDFTLDALTVDDPTISMATHTASNTVQVTINPGGTGEDLVAETIEVQYFDPILGWIAAPIADSMVNGTGTSVFYDGLHAPGEEVNYRARGVASFDGATFASTWTQASTHTVADPEEWWLRSASDHTLNQNLNEVDGLLMRDWKLSRQKPNTTGWGIGARTATMAHDVTKGDVHDCSIWAFGITAYTALRALLEDGDDLVLVNPWGELWRVQVGGQVDEEVIKAAPSATETTPLGFVRVVNVQFVEVVTP